MMKIHDAALSGDIDGVAKELAAGVDINVEPITSLQTALHLVVAQRDASPEMVRHLIRQDSRISQAIFDEAIKHASIETLKILFDFGCKSLIDNGEAGYCMSLTSAAYGRHAATDLSLVPVFELLIGLGASIEHVSSCNESALSVASQHGRFDAVKCLLDHGANPAPLEWNELMRTVALGSAKDVLELAKTHPVTTGIDHCQRTPFLLSVLTGDLMKVQIMLAIGVNQIDRIYNGFAAVMCAVEGNHAELLAWLLVNDFPVNGRDEWQSTPLYYAAELGHSPCVEVLLKFGANPTQANHIGEEPISVATNSEVITLLHAAGADLSKIDDDVRIEFLKLKGGDPAFTPADFLAGRNRVYGRSNPERMDEPFWHAMIQSSCSAYAARCAFGYAGCGRSAVWCNKRFGRSTTLMPDGRIIEIAGEHEDHYDQDFCIYNDVVVFDGHGRVEIFGYPEAVFPPTDFHTATLVGDYIYVIGCLGNGEQRVTGFTPVFRLDSRTMQMERIQTTGDSPGWIYNHEAAYDSKNQRILISSGKICGGNHVDNDLTFALSLETWNWSHSKLEK